MDIKFVLSRIINKTVSIKMKEEVKTNQNVCGGQSWEGTTKGVP